MTHRQRIPGSKVRSVCLLRAGIASAVLALIGPSMALAANAPFPTVTTPVKLNGITLASVDWNEELNTIVYDGGQYHMWYVPAAFTMSAGIQYATSTVGVNFTTVGSLTVPANWWVAGGASAEPWSNYLRVSRDGSGNWILMVWHPNGSFGSYTYNTSLWLIGSNIANATLTPIGPLPSSPGGNHVGPFGIVGSDIYLGQDTAQAFGRYTLAPAPITSPPGMQDAADAFAGTGFCWYGCSDTAKEGLHKPL